MKTCATEFLLAFVALNIMIFTSSEYDAALIDLEPLLSTTEKIVKTLDKYIELEGKRLQKIKGFSQDYDNLHKSSTKDFDSFLSNPINAYLLVKRLTTDWKFVLNLVEGAESKAVVNNLTQKDLFPSDSDLEEATNSLILLQDTYLLNTTDLAQGEVAGMRAATELTVSDCFQVGLKADEEGYFKLAEQWFQESLDRFDENEFVMVEKTVLLDYLIHSAYLAEDVEKALELTKYLIEIDPNHPTAYENLQFYENELIKKNNKDVIDPARFDVKIYKKLCRGERLRTPAQERKLKCRHTSNGSKYLLLHPAKEETLNLDPWVVVYHDVIRDHDIEIVKELSEHKLKRAKVVNDEAGTTDFSKDRLSKSVTLADSSHPRVARISKLIGEITGLATNTAEELQMNKYGIGGHYKGHCDYRRPGEFDDFAALGIGNRIATWLFYLNDVEAGGSTVFPDLGVQVKPIKGSAVFWYNLFNSGEGDLRTKHAACPVIAGQKWVANKWLHERGQEFRRPCGLKPLPDSLKIYTS